MHIAIDGRYIQDYFPGIARYTYNLVENLADIVDGGITLYHNPRMANARYDLSLLRRPGKVELHALDVATFSIPEQLRLPAALWRDGVRIFHSPYYFKPYVHPGKSIVTIHDVISAIYPRYLPSTRARLIFEITTRLALAGAARIIVPSRSSKNDLIGRYGVKPEKIAVTYEAADARFCPRDKRSLHAIRERYGLPESYILYVGINKPHKNLARLIQAFASLKSCSTVSLVIAGKEDPRYAQARMAAERSPARERIIFLGSVPEVDLPYLYNLADLFVFPSLYEGFGLPLLEAMASGVPVVCSNRSSLPEIAGDAGLLIDPENTGELAEAMARAIEDRALRDRMRERGLERAKMFAWRETARQTLDVYRLVALC